MLRQLPLPRGALTISIDLEILWGVWDLSPHKTDRLAAPLERTIATRLLDLFERHDVRATWAIVGRLLDDSRGFDGLRGPKEAWFAPDIVDRIRESRVEHEVGSHSYGHVYFNAIDREEALFDLARAKSIHRSRGLPFRSLVFPRNLQGHLDVLRSVGLEVYRTSDAGILGWTERHAGRLRPALNVVEKAVALPSPLVDAYDNDGLVELPTSMLLMARSGPRKIIHPRALAHKITSGVRRAAAERRIFHLWFHPSNFYDAMDSQLSILEEGLRVAAHLRDRGELDVRTMADYADLRSSAKRVA